MVCVIPSNRQINLNYLAPLIDAGVRFIIVDDSEGKVNLNHPLFEIFNWNDRKKILGNHDEYFPRRNGASRDFGFYMAWKNSDPGEIIVALDDDCEIYQDDFAQQVEKSLSSITRPVVSCTAEHLNILDFYTDSDGTIFPRGFPYSERAKAVKSYEKGNSDDVVSFSLGLWKNYFDVNAIDKLNGFEYNFPQAEIKHRSVIIDKNKYISVCSMNMQFRRELIPAVFQLPMHIEIMPGWVIDRYGDIWGGFILKMLMDIRNEAMAVGEPLIRHHKEGNIQRNMWQEHIGHLVNDEFLNILKDIRQNIDPADYLSMMAQVSEQFNHKITHSSILLKPYLKYLCMSFNAWINVLSK